MPGMMDPIGPHICPNCGERVSAYAAGCPQCGATLDPNRGSGAPSPMDRVKHLTTFLKTKTRKRPR